MALPASATTVSAPTDAIGQAIAWTDIREDAKRAAPGGITLRVIDGRIVSNRLELCYASFAYFMSELRDEAGKPLRVDEHHIEWADHLQHEPLLCMLAPRTHGKSWTLGSYLLWRAWRHNRDPRTGELIEGLPQGRLQLVLFSDTLTLAEERFEEMQRLAANDHNAWLFGDMVPRRWAKRRGDFRNLTTIMARGYRTSTRGLHPDVIALDDVLNDTNTLTKYQRDKVWRYFTAVLLPMGASQYIVVGTAMHQDDLLHRLRPDPKKPIALTVGDRPAVFRWLRYRAANFTIQWVDDKGHDRVGKVLWPWRWKLGQLKALQEWDPLLYSREFNNEPVDDSASYFPYKLTNKATARGEHEILVKVPWDLRELITLPAAARMVFVPIFRPEADEFVVLGHDLALGAEATSDFTVIKVAAYHRWTGQRRLLWTFRAQGLPLDAQIILLRMACSAFNVTIGVVESNGFQRWLHAETIKYSETNTRLVPHTTGQEKASLEQGVPSVRLALEHDLWTVPIGDVESKEAALIWQAEMQAYGWKDGKLQGVGEHDDEVMAWYFLDRACKLIDELILKVEQADDDLVTGEDLGIERVRIGPSYDP